MPPEQTRCARSTRTRGRVPRRHVPLPGGGRAGRAATSTLHVDAGDHDRDRRQHRCGQVDAGLARPAAVRRHRRERARRRCGRARTRPGAAVASGSASCRRGRTCSAGRSRATCATADPRRPTRSCGRRCARRRHSDFVAAMPGGLDAPIAQGGTNVSGGQRQRLAIARALVRRPEIYLFDESFSALDLGTDARLRAALRPVTRDAAVLVVASRISTIADADQIVVLDGGRVVGIGRHDELLDDLPDLRRDRRVAAVAPRRPHERRRDARRAARAGRSTPGRLPAAGGEARRGGGPPWMGAAMPAEKAMTFGPSAKRLLRPAAPAPRQLLLVLALGARQRDADGASGPKLLGHATDLIFTRLPRLAAAVRRSARRVVADARAPRRRRLRRPAAALARRTRASASTSARSARCCCWRSRSTSSRACSRGCRAMLLNRVVRRTVRQLRSDVEDKLAPAAAALRRRAAARRAAQPGHQRHRQHRADPAADAEPAAHVAAHRRRRRRDDVRDLAAARGHRAGHDPGDDLRHEGDRASARSRSSSRSGRRPAGSTRTSRRRSPATRSCASSAAQRESEQTFADTNDELFEASLGAQFVSGMIMPSMMFIGNLNYVVIAVVGGLRVASGTLSLGDVQAFIQYSRQFTQPLTQVASMANLLQSGVASAERVFDLLDAPEQSPDPAHPQKPLAAPRPGRVRARRLPLPAGRAADRGPVAGRRARAHDRDRRPDRRRARPRWST